jgi:hypothetical protein
LGAASVAFDSRSGALADGEVEEDRHHAQDDRRGRELACVEGVTSDAELRPTACSEMPVPAGAATNWLATNHQGQ